MEEISIPELPVREPAPPIPVEKKDWSKFIGGLCVGIFIGLMLFGAITFLGYTDAFMTDGQCDELILNQTNQSFINGSIYGSLIFQNAIMNQSLHCESIPFGFQNETYNLVLIECLNLNTQEVK